MQATKHQFDISLSPDAFLARLRAETVAYNDIINMSDLLCGYKTYLVESFTGSKQVVSQIVHHTFKLMPIGIWPIKGHSAVANAGALEGTVVATEAGSRVTTRYRFALALVVFVVVLGLASLCMVAIAVIVTMWNPPSEGLLLVQTVAVASCLVTSIFAAYYWIGGQTQERRVMIFLEELLEGT